MAKKNKPAAAPAAPAAKNEKPRHPMAGKSPLDHPTFGDLVQLGVIDPPEAESPE